jgi:tetratricopeptide (TPR) repeat protein
MKFSKDQYIYQAQALLDKYEYGMALKFLLKAFETERDGNVAFMIGNCYLDLQQTDDSQNHANAIEWLLKSLEINGGKGWQQCLSLAQLHAEKESAEWYERGISQLQEILSSDELSLDKRAELVRSTSNALCALTELYMTDCWY